MQHTYDIVNKKGEVTTTVVFGEVSTGTMQDLRARLSLPQHPQATVLLPGTFAYVETPQQVKPHVPPAPPTVMLTPNF